MSQAGAAKLKSFATKIQSKFVSTKKLEKSRKKKKKKKKKVPQISIATKTQPKSIATETKRLKTLESKDSNPNTLSKKETEEEDAHQEEGNEEISQPKQLPMAKPLSSRLQLGIVLKMLCLIPFMLKKKKKK